MASDRVEEKPGEAAMELLRSAMEHLKKVSPRVGRTRSPDTKIKREHAEGIERMRYQREQLELAVMDLQSTARDNLGANWRRNQIPKDEE